MSGQDGTSKRETPRLVPILLVLILGVVSSTALFVVLRANTRADLQKELDWVSSLYTITLQRELDHIVDDVDSPGLLFDTGLDVTRQQFQEFVTPSFDPHPEIKTLAWIPLVTGSRRASFESRARMEGLNNFHITERQADGSKVPASERQEYFPMYYVEPLSANETGVGFDLASDGAREGSLEEARDTGGIVTAGQPRLVQSNENDSDLLLFRPVYLHGILPVTVEDRRKNLAGFTFGLVLISEFIKDSLKEVTDVSTSIYEEDLSGGMKPLYTEEEADRRGAAGGDLSRAKILRLPDRTWRIIFEPKASFYDRHRNPLAWVVFLALLAVTLLISLNMLNMSQRIVRIGALSAQLSKMNRDLRTRIIENEKAEKALRESEDRVRQMQKMEAIGQLAGGIAHDFNNILMVILGYSDVLLAKHAAEGPLRAHVQAIKTAATRAGDLTHQLLAFSRKQLLRPQVVNMNDLIRESEKMFRRLIREDIELSIHLGEEETQIRVDPGQLVQILMNLTVNARDAMPRGGNLIIETKNVEFSARDTAARTELKPGRYVQVAVSDTGVGMDAETKSHIFEPFFTTKDIGKGTGLGLATIYGIVKQSEGYVYVYSELGKGTTFKVYLPRIDGGPSSRIEQDGIPIESLRGTETILLAEDEDEVRSLIRVILQNNGYTVIEARNGKEVIKIYREWGERICGLITDVVMPGMGGMEAARQIRRIRPGLAVLFITGYTEDFIALNEMLEDGMAILQKPLRTEELLRRLRQSLDSTKKRMS